MAWKPVKLKQTGPSPRAREMISRGTSIFICLVCFYGAYRCFSTAKWVMDDNDAREMKDLEQQVQRGVPNPHVRHNNSGAGYPLIFGVGLALVGLVAGLGAVMPPSFWEQFNAPPRDVDDDVQKVRRWSRGRFW